MSSPATTNETDPPENEAVAGAAAPPQVDPDPAPTTSKTRSGASRFSASRLSVSRLSAARFRPSAPRAGWSAAGRDLVAASRRRTRDWLDRPMTSFHLLMAVFFMLLGFGLLMVLSSSSVVAYGRDGSSFSAFKKQLLFAGVGLVAFWAMMRVKLSWLKAMSTTGMIISLAMLVVVLGMPQINGAHSWITLGPVNFQPSELAKFALVIWGANVLASRRANLGSWKELLIPVLPVALLMGLLIMLEPDLGTTAALLVIVFALFFFAGASWKMFGILATLGVGGLALLATSASYRLARVTSFLNPESDPQGSGLQLLQGLYGMANGGLFGVGLGQSRAKWAYLPHAESDFIFAIVGEELGFLGAALLIGLYITLALVGLRIARRNVDPFIKLVAATSTAWLVGQAAINIFYVVGLLPVTGLTLPMISAGGTSLLVTMAIFGLLANFSRREPQAMAALQHSGPGVISRFFGIGVPGAGGVDETTKKAQQREERQQSRRGARASAKAAADGGLPETGRTDASSPKPAKLEKPAKSAKPSKADKRAAEQRALQAAARQRPLDRRDEPGRATDRRGPAPRSTGSSPVRGASRPAPPLNRPSRPPLDRSPLDRSDRPAARSDFGFGSGSGSGSTARPARPEPTPPKSGGVLRWLGFGATPSAPTLPTQRDRRHADSRTVGGRGADRRGGGDSATRGPDRGRGTR